MRLPFERLEAASASAAWVRCEPRRARHLKPIATPVGEIETFATKRQQKGSGCDPREGNIGASDYFQPSRVAGSLLRICASIATRDRAKPTAARTLSKPMTSPK